MSMFTLQTLGLILLFGLIGLFFGWLIRSFFCKPSISGRKMGSADTSVKTSVDTSYAKANKSASTSGANASVDAKAGSGTLNKTATAAAGVAAVAATAAAVASNKKDAAVDTVSSAVDSASDSVPGGATDSKSGAIEAAAKDFWGDTDTASSSVSGAVESTKETASDGISGSAAAGLTGAAALAAAAYSASSSAGETDSPQQLRQEAETMLDKDFAGSATDSVKGTASGAIDSATDTIDSAKADVSGSVSDAVDATSGGISGAAAGAGAAGAAAVAAAAYSANSSADVSGNGSDTAAANANTVNAGTATGQGIVGSATAEGTSHIIIGAGPAGVVAAETIRKLDSNAIITIIGDEPEAPYSRMAIPYFLEENIQAEGTHLRKTENHYEALDIQVLSGRVKSVDTENKQVQTANGLTLDYDKLLIATGSHPLTPPIPGLDNPKVGNCWDLADSRKIIENVKPGSSVVQIGAGFIGCIILESLVKRGAKLTVVEMDNRMVPRMLDDQCGGMLKSWCESKGVSVLTETMVQSIENNGDRLKVNLSKGDAIDADYVISATGVASNTAFLEGSGIQIDQGVLVNHNLETNIPDVYAAGDVAQGIDFTTGGYSVHAIQPTAADHGTISAKNMVKGNTTRHKGSLQMNILSTLDLISTSYGAWEGVEGGEHTELVDQEKYRYIRLQFKDDMLVGANTLGITQNIGAIRGLIQSKHKLGVWKERLMDNPLHFMDAYVALTGNHA